jgi:hypothetical protein
MTSAQFARAHRRVNLYGALVVLTMLGLLLAAMPSVVLLVPVDESGRPLRYRLLGIDEPICNWILGPLFMLIFGLGSVTVICLELRVGVPCPTCGQSLTGNGRRVLQTGRCPCCQVTLFEPDERFFRKSPTAKEFPRTFGTFLLTSAAFAWACFLISLVPLRSVWAPWRDVEGRFLAFAFAVSPMIAGVATWAALRVRHRTCYAAAAAATLLTLLVYYRAIGFR